MRTSRSLLPVLMDHSGDRVEVGVKRNRLLRFAIGVGEELALHGRRQLAKVEPDLHIRKIVRVKEALRRLADFRGRLVDDALRPSRPTLPKARRVTTPDFRRFLCPS